MTRLRDKVALVTGAGSGFGAGIAEAFCAAGAKVGILDRSTPAAESVAKQLGDRARSLTADITDKASFARAVQDIEQWAGPLDIMVNNAGLALPPTPLDEVAEADFDRLCAVNMRGQYLAALIVVPGMKARQKGCILNIASTAGVSPRADLTWYNASKGWVITATRSMAVELAPYNIRVNALNPVAGETPLLATFLGEDTPEARARFLATIPLGRFSTPADVGHAAVYLCSDEAAMVTGVAMEIDGGRCI